MTKNFCSSFIITLYIILETMIELYWNILREQGRVLKAAADLAKIPCKFVPIKYTQQHTQQQTEQRLIIDSLQSLMQMEKNLPSSSSLFGRSQQEKKNIKHHLQLYKAKFQPLLRLSLFDLVFQRDPVIQKQKISNKRSEIQSKLKEFDGFLSQVQTQFICGQAISIVDLLFYFDVCNLSYFGKNPSKYPHVWQWFQEVYKLRQVRILTHQWFAMAKQISALFKPKRQAKAPSL